MVQGNDLELDSDGQRLGSFIYYSSFSCWSSPAPQPTRHRTRGSRTRVDDDKAAADAGAKAKRTELGTNRLIDHVLED